MAPGLAAFLLSLPVPSFCRIHPCTFVPKAVRALDTLSKISICPRVGQQSYG